jgi:hypothetical protein
MRWLTASASRHVTTHYDNRSRHGSSPGARCPYLVSGLTPPGADIGAVILHLVEASGPGKSISPSQVARTIGPVWQPLMGAVRREAIRLALAGRIDILRKGKPVAPAGVRGVIRLRLRLSEDAP